jgi:hypothetical protein
MADELLALAPGMFHMEGGKLEVGDVRGNIKHLEKVRSARGRPPAAAAACGGGGRQHGSPGATSDAASRCPYVAPAGAGPRSCSSTDPPPLHLQVRMLQELERWTEVLQVGRTGRACRQALKCTPGAGAPLASGSPAAFACGQG